MDLKGGSEKEKSDPQIGKNDFSLLQEKIIEKIKDYQLIINNTSKREIEVINKSIRELRKEKNTLTDTLKLPKDKENLNNKLKELEAENKKKMLSKKKIKF